MAENLLERLEAEARAQNPDVAAEYSQSRSSSPGGDPLIPLPAPRTLGASSSKSLEPQVASPMAVEADAPTADVASPAAAETVLPAPTQTAKVVKKRPLPPDPKPKKPPKPQPTIRIEIGLTEAVEALPRHGVFELDCEAEARERGLRVIQSESEKEDSESEGGSDDEEEAEPKQPAFSAATAAVLGQVPGKKTGKRKKRVEDRDEGYDTEDSFVDDSELHVDMPKFYMRPERDGFYVHKGQLKHFELTGAKTRKSRAPASKKAAEEEEPPKKRAKKAPLTNGTPARSRSKSKQDDDEDVKRKLPKNAIAFAAAGDTPEKRQRTEEPKADAKNFTPELQTMAAELITLIAATSFVPKNKFPADLKPPLHAFALKAVETLQYDDHFFRYLAEIFPYNRFTMEKLTKREIFPMRIELIKEHQDKLIKDLEALIAPQIPISEAHYAKEMEGYESKLVKWKAAEEAKGGDAMAVDEEDKKPPTSKGQKGKGPPEPTKKVLFTEDMRRVLFEIIVCDDEIVAITKEKAELEKNEDDMPKEKVMRKTLYARLLTLFPDDMMTTTLISRNWSQAKAKYGTGGADGEADD